MVEATDDASRLAAFYGGMSSLDGILNALAAAGVDVDRPVPPGDLYRRDLDCHNLGMHRMLEWLATVVTEYGAPQPGHTVLDLGCGMGGPGRFLVDRFACSIVGCDLLPLRIEIANALTKLTGLRERIAYHVADATRLPIDDRRIDQVWMLDVSMHIHDKQALFAEIARVLRPGGLLLMHDQTGPLPAAMRPLMRQAPYVAPSLPQLVRYVDRAGLRVLTWRDTTEAVLDYFLRVRSLLESAEPQAAPRKRSTRRQGHEFLDAYIETLARRGGRTGTLIAKRVIKSRSATAP